jgi:Lrp/AsnC family leucine-responsive transcriptional regulator
MSYLDSIDARIMEILQRDGRASHSAIAEEVGLSQPSVHDRVKKLEQRGVIKGYTAILDPQALDLGVLAFISVRHNVRDEEISRSVGEMPNVLEVHHIAGEDCLLVKVRCSAPADLEHVLDRLWSTGGVAATKTTIVLSTYKETVELPLDGGRSEDELQREEALRA